VTGGGSAKENDLKKTLDELVKNRGAMDGVNKIILDELFNTGFMKKRTRFSSWNEVVETAYAEWVTTKPFEGVWS